MMKTSSQFLFTGAAVLTLVFLFSGEWLMLPLGFFAGFFGLMQAEREQLEAMDDTTLAMHLARDDTPLLPLDDFRGEGLMYYHAGQPVYRILQARDSRWHLVGEAGKVQRESGMIRVFPGLVYRKGE